MSSVTSGTATRREIRESGEVCSPGCVGAAEPLSLWELPLWIHLVHEALRERRTRSASRLARVVEGMHAVRGHSTAKRSLRRSHA